MFLNGKIYDIKRAPPAMQTAAAGWLARASGGCSEDPLIQYDRMVAAMENLDFLRWLCKHLIPDLPREEVTAETTNDIRRAIELRHRDPDRELALTIMRQRKWEADRFGVKPCGGCKKRARWLDRQWARFRKWLGL